MKNPGLISLLSVPLAVLIGMAVMSLMDTSGFAAIGAAFVFTIIVFVAGIVGIICGILAIKSGTINPQGKVGVIFGLLVVGGGISFVLYVHVASEMEYRREVAANAVEEKAKKAAYDASPDIESNSIPTLLESPYLDVEINDIAPFPGGKILVNFGVSGGRSGSKILVYSVDGKQDSDFAFEIKEKPWFLRKRLLTAPNGNFLLVSEEMQNLDTCGDYGGRWTNENPTLLRNRKGKLTSGTIENSGDVSVVRFDQSGKLYGIEWISPVYRYDNEEKVVEKNLIVNLVEMPFNGKAFRHKASLETALLKQMRDYDLELLSPEDLFFWPNGDIGLIVSLFGHYFVHRIDPTGRRIVSSFETGSKSFSEPNHCIGFLPDGGLILSERYDRNNIVCYRNGKKVASFSKSLEKLRKRIEIHAATVISTGYLVLAGNPHDKKKIIQFVVIDAAGNEKNGFVLGKVH